MSDDRIAELEREVRQLRGLLEQSLLASAPNVSATVGAADAESRVAGAASDEPVTRRTALRTAGVLAAGAIAGGAGLVASAAPAAAATGGPFDATTGTPGVLSRSTGATDTAIKAEVTGAGIGLTVYAPGVDATGALISANASGGYAAVLNGGSKGAYVTALDGGVGVEVDVYGASGYGVYTQGPVGLLANGSSGGGGPGVGIQASGSVVPLRLGGLGPGHAAPPTRAVAFTAGMIDFDTNEDLWVCVESGTPGTWRKIAGPTSGGAFHPITPVRAYDSRKVAYALNGVIAKTTNRTVSVADSHDTSTGALVTSNVVPVGAKAVAANVTVTGTTGTCFFCVNPGGTTTLGASTINWFGSGQILANGVILTLDANRQVTIVAGDSLYPASAHCIIDITGYWL